MSAGHAADHRSDYRSQRREKNPAVFEAGGRPTPIAPAQQAAFAWARWGWVPRPWCLHEACEFLVLAWHHEHLSYQAGAKPKRYHHHEHDFWLACAEGLLGDAFDSLKTLVFDKLDSIVRASSLVEMVNALLRPYLNSCKGQITQQTLNLIMFYHNHRRYKSGKRQGQAPIALLTGEPLEAPWWELLRHQITTEPGVTVPDTGPSSSLLQLVPNNEERVDQSAMTSDRVIVDPTEASQTDGRHKESKAA